MLIFQFMEVCTLKNLLPRSHFSNSTGLGEIDENTVKQWNFKLYILRKKRKKADFKKYLVVFVI